MASFWQKLNHLIPEPQCRTKGGRITAWTDTRLQPSDAAINAVSHDDAMNSLIDPDETYITEELAKGSGNPFEILKRLRKLGRI